MKKALDTISETPWILAIIVATLCVVVILLTLDGQITVEVIADKLLLVGTGTAIGGLVTRPKNKDKKP